MLSFDFFKTHHTSIIKNTDQTVFHSFTNNSQNVKKGSVFFDCASRNQYVIEALEKGASLIVTSASVYESLRDTLSQVSVVTSSYVRKLYAEACAFQFPLQPSNCVAITGTNGKSSTVHFLKQLWQGQGLQCASLGTLGLNSTTDVHIKLPSLTTLDPLSFHKTLHMLKEKGVDHLAFEASSHGLDQYRLHASKVSAAGFTNLSQDHLDYHQSMESYFEAKLLLFKEILSKEGIAVINNDCLYGQKVIAACQHYGIKTITYSTLDQKSDLYAKIIDYSTQGMKISLRLESVNHTLTLPVVGDFQVSNLLCAIGLFMDSIAKSLFDEKKLIQSIEKLKAPFGRMEHVGTTPQGGSVYIDYAHTPDALKRALLTLKKHTQKKLVVLFGCGGDRDKKKRPMMGEIAYEYADKVIITDDNPRTECATGIRKQIAKACPDAFTIGNRADAIHKAIVEIHEGDILLIAGKGHEQGQIIGTQTFPFCDKKIARQIIQSL